MSRLKNKGENELLRKRLLQMRAELKLSVEQRRREMVMECEPEDEIAVALRNASTGVVIADIERKLRTLDEIDLSLRRISTGQYGYCGLCGEKIPLGRLKAIPWTRSCVDCAGGGVPRGEQGTRPKAKEVEYLPAR